NTGFFFSTTPPQRFTPIRRTCSCVCSRCDTVITACSRSLIYPRDGHTGWSALAARMASYSDSSRGYFPAHL
ncbi:hypothetical protein BDN67DRAFT_967881, partial [Paxillus ammoniavirescens]